MADGADHEESVRNLAIERALGHNTRGRRALICIRVGIRAVAAPAASQCLTPDPAVTPSSLLALQVMTRKSLNETSDGDLFERVDAAITAYFDADSAARPTVAPFVTYAIALRVSNRG